MNAILQEINTQQYWLYILVFLYKSISQSFFISQSVSQPVSQPVFHSFIQSVSKSFIHSFIHSVSHLVIQSASQSVNQSASHFLTISPLAAFPSRPVLALCSLLSSHRAQNHSFARRLSPCSSALLTLHCIEASANVSRNSFNPVPSLLSSSDSLT